MGVAGVPAAPATGAKFRREIRVRRRSERPSGIVACGSVAPGTARSINATSGDLGVDVVGGVVEPGGSPEQVGHRIGSATVTQFPCGNDAILIGRDMHQIARLVTDDH